MNLILISRSESIQFTMIPKLISPKVSLVPCFVGVPPIIHDYLSFYHWSSPDEDVKFLIIKTSKLVLQSKQPMEETHREMVVVFPRAKTQSLTSPDGAMTFF